MSSALGIQKKILLGIFVLVSCFLLLTPVAHAQGGPAGAGLQLSITNYKAPQNTNYSFLNIFHSIACEGIGSSIFLNQICLWVNPTGGVMGYNTLPSGGAVGGLNNAMVAMYNTPPATVSEYLADMGTNFGLIPKAYAQVPGSGSGVIQPVFKIWQVVRDVSYLGFILVFIVIGFMIMFRQRLNPQTVITVQSALPGLVIGLILVTFSYFIAALLIDVSFFTVQIIGSLFIQVGDNGLGNGDQLLQITQRADIFELFKYFTLNGNTMNTISAPIISAFDATSTQSGITIQGVVMDIFKATNPAFAIPGAAGGGVSGLVIIILIIAVIIQMIRLVWSLLQAYISIFVNTILGPIFILYSTLPGRRGVLTFWWKNILGNALIFPAVFAAVLFAGFIVGPVGANPNQFGSSLPFLSFPQGTLRGILAFGIILGTPAIPKMVKSAIGVKDLGDIATTAIGGVAAGAAYAGGAGNFAYSGAMEKLGISARRKALQERDRAAGAASAPYSSGSLKDFWAKHGPGK